MRNEHSDVGSERSIYVEDFAYDVIDTLLQKTFACTYLSVRFGEDNERTRQFATICRHCNPKEINLVPANVILRYMFPVFFFCVDFVLDTHSLVDMGRSLCLFFHDIPEKLLSRNSNLWTGQAFEQQ
ncbi:hypothetical protein MKX03_003576 [Papaver bracteatum]|nr:hypothetical protein MKX03_003576 [Papaver bracteatum]